VIAITVIGQWINSRNDRNLTNQELDILKAIRRRQADQDRNVKPKLGPPKGRPMNAALAEQLRRALLDAFRW
jgi:hypothetical protein